MQLLPPLSAAAQQRTEILLTPEGITLSGASPTYERTISVPAGYDRSAGARLKIDWTTSDLIDLTKSIMTIFLDDDPIRSSRLLSTQTGPGHGRLLLLLPAMAPGFHRIALHLTLRVPGDPCLNEHEEATWIRLSPTSSVTWRARQTSPAPTLTLRRLKPSLASMHPNGLHVHSPVANHPGITEAAIRLDHWLRDAELVGNATLNDDAVPSPDKEMAKPVVTQLGIVLSTLEHLQEVPVHPMLVDHVAENPALTGAAHLSNRELHILGRDGQGLSAAVTLLTSHRAARLCQTLECYSGEFFDAPHGPKDSRESQGAKGDPADAPSLTVLTLKTHGHPSGWTAQGSGTHRLSIHWVRPPSYQINDVATLELDLRLPVTGPMNRKSSRLRVDLNGTPLAGYTLARIDKNIETLRIGVPKEYNTSNAWHFEIEVKLRNDETLPCTHSNDDLTWLVIGPGSALNVPRKEAADTGISELLQIALRDGVQVHQSRPLSSTEVSAVSAVTYGFRTPKSPPIRVQASNEQCTPLCLTPTSGLPGDYFSLRESPIAIPSGNGGKLRVPALLRDGLLVLTKTRSDDSADPTAELTLWISPSNGTNSRARRSSLPTPSAPPLHPWRPANPRLLERDTAIYVDSKWHSVGPHSTFKSTAVQVRRKVEAIVAPSRTSDQEALWIKINLLWLCGSLALLTALAALFKFTRARSLRTDQGPARKHENSI